MGMASYPALYHQYTVVIYDGANDPENSCIGIKVEHRRGCVTIVNTDSTGKYMTVNDHIFQTVPLSQCSFPWRFIPKWIISRPSAKAKRMYARNRVKPSCNPAM